MTKTVRKTKLNKSSRIDLIQYAAKSIECEAEKAAVIEAVNAANKAVAAAVNKTYSASEMEVLKKYNAAKYETNHFVVFLGDESGDRREAMYEFRLPEFEAVAYHDYKRLSEYAPNSVALPNVRLNVYTDDRRSYGDERREEEKRICEAVGVTATPSGRASNKPVEIDAATLDLIAAAKKAVDAYETAMQEKFAAYRTLIIQSVYIEDVLEVWPNAKGSVSDYLGTGTALTISKEVLDFIKADNAPK